MRLVAVTTIFFLFLALIKGQRFPGGYGFPNAFGGGLDASLGLRDPRQNTGPVVFPPAPPDNGETSGVVAGASGYGFVPPGGQSYDLEGKEIRRSNMAQDTIFYIKNVFPSQEDSLFKIFLKSTEAQCLKISVIHVLVSYSAGNGITGT